MAVKKRYCTYEQFCDLLALQEGGSKSQDIAQLKEGLRIATRLLYKAGVDIYKIIETTPYEVFTRGMKKCQS